MCNYDLNDNGGNSKLFPRMDTESRTLSSDITSGKPIEGDI
jgi:hypothetical protein